ncbi:MAG TPA: helicase HerA-like domain-containing protein [Acidimicrobiales bacterium]|jgi:hypothetical protein
MSDGLNLGSGLILPVDSVTETFGILAKKGAGKSNAAVVMAEEMWSAGVPWVAVDPKGDWWGVRSSADGQHPGLPLPVFGGKHGDFPLQPEMGPLIADIVLGDERRGYLPCVLDVSQFTISEQRRFLLAFGERLFRHKDEERVLHLFLEEAHEYLPQSVDKDQRPLVSTWQRIVKQGRFKGLGVTVVSQRSAALNKDVLTQVDSLIVLRTLSPQDRAAVKGWVETHAEAGEVLASLPSLQDGEAWLWSPERLAEPARFRFRRRSTFDSGATPKVGQIRRAPATLADIDAAAIKEQMAETIERAKADDPKELRRRVAALDRELAAARSATPEPVVERVEVPVLPDETVARLVDALAPVADALAEVRGLLVGHGAVPRRDDTRRSEVQPAAKEARGPSPRAAGSASARGAQPPAGDSVRLGKTEHRVLSVLAQFPAGRTHRQLALLTGYSAKASTIGVALSKLRKAGLVEPTGNPIKATDDGLRYAAEHDLSDELPVGAGAARLLARPRGWHGAPGVGRVRRGVAGRVGQGDGG